MKATVSRKGLSAALKAVTPAVAKGGSLPILAGVRIEATSAGLDLCCSDLTLTATALVHDAERVIPGVAIPPALLLGKIVEKLGGEHVTLELDGYVLTITSDETVATVRSWSVEDWPQLPVAEGETGTLSAADVALLERILPMASADLSRPTILGVYLTEGEAAATDSYRLGVLDGLPELGSVLVPATALRLALADGGPVDVRFGGRIATFTHGDRTLTTTLIEAEYPKYRGLVRDESPYTLTFARHELARAVDRASISALVDKKASTKAIHIERDGDKARVWSSDTESASSVSDTIGCRGDYEGVIGLNPDFIADILAAVEEDDVTFGIVDQLKPVVVTSGRLTLVLMPTRIGAT